MSGARDTTGPEGADPVDVDAAALPVLDSLDHVVECVGRGDGVYVRWSRGPDIDLKVNRSRDEMTGAEMPGLCANSMAVQDWWGDRPLRTWVARRLHDYLHLRNRRPGVVAWLLRGEEVSRGPDNEPVVDRVEPVALLSPQVAEEAAEVVRREEPGWGSLDRSTADAN